MFITDINLPGAQLIIFSSSTCLIILIGPIEKIVEIQCLYIFPMRNIEIIHLLKMFYSNQYEQQQQQQQVVDEVKQKSSRSNKQLPEKAIRLMTAWYLAHEDNPYPNRNDLDYLATNGGIKESQVKAWFSNKRNRTQNTHPKRAKRYLNRTQTQSNEPQKLFLAEQFEQQINWSSIPAQSYDYSQYYYNS